MKRIYKRRYVKLEVDVTNNLLVQTWLAYCTSKEFRKTQQKTLKYFEKYKCKKFVSNTLKAGVLDQTDSHWAAEYVTPKLHDFGMQSMHFVIPQNTFALMAIKNYEEKDQEITKMKTFFYPNVEEAIEKAIATA